MGAMGVATIGMEGDTEENLATEDKAGRGIDVHVVIGGSGNDPL